MSDKEFSSVNLLITQLHTESKHGDLLKPDPLKQILQQTRAALPQVENQNLYLFDGGSEYVYYKANYELLPTTIHRIDPETFDLRQITPGDYFLVELSRVPNSKQAIMKRHWERLTADPPPMRQVFRTSESGLFEITQ